MASLNLKKSWNTALGRAAEYLLEHPDKSRLFDHLAPGVVLSSSATAFFLCVALDPLSHFDRLADHVNPAISMLAYSGGSLLTVFGMAAPLIKIQKRRFELAHERWIQRYEAAAIKAHASDTRSVEIVQDSPYL